MPEIQLPTKANQDAIKMGVDTLLNGRVVKSVQRGSGLAVDGIGTVIFSSVNTLKSLYYINVNGTNADGQTYERISFTANELKLKFSGSSSSSAKFEWQLIEYY